MDNLLDIADQAQQARDESTIALQRGGGLDRLVTESTARREQVATAKAALVADDVAAAATKDLAKLDEDNSGDLDSATGTLTAEQMTSIDGEFTGLAKRIADIEKQLKDAQSAAAAAEEAESVAASEHAAALADFDRVVVRRDTTVAAIASAGASDAAGTSADASTRYRRTTLRAQQLKALRANLDRIKTLPADLDEALSRVTDAQTNASAASLAKAATSLSVARLTKLVAAYGDPSQQLLLLSAFAPKEPPINP